MPRFRTGDVVEIRGATAAGHIRTPWYVRHKTGTVERWCGAYLNPEDLAYGRRDRPAVDLYRVTLRQTDLWPDYRGSPADTLDIEIYDHWLSPAPDAKGRPL